MQAAVPQVNDVPRNRPLGWVVAVFGLVFVGLGIALAIFHQYQLASYSGRATGVVVDFRTTSGSSSRASNGSLAPVVRFATANGEAVQFTSSLASTPPRFSIGQQVTVAYDPANPSQATIDSFWDNWFFSLVTAGVGLFFFLVGLAVRRSPSIGSSQE